AWQASPKRPVAPTQVRPLAETVGPWQIDVIGPIRGLGRMLKGNAPLLDKGPAELFRTKIKAIELEAERLQQEAMCAMAAGMTSETAPSVEAAARASIAAYESVAVSPFTPEAGDTLIAALKSPPPPLRPT